MHRSGAWADHRVDPHVYSIGNAQQHPASFKGRLLVCLRNHLANETLWKETLS